MVKVEAAGAPAAIGPYGHAIAVDGAIYTSGQLGLVPDTGALAEGGIQGQSEQAIKNLAAVLEAGGSALTNVVKTTCFLSDLKDFAAFNEIYAKYFPQCPARSCFAVKELPKDALIEIEAIAVK